jgi:aspartyl-tRNA(Asn)/glutamyl-tRNA(Gln) amidotransferase subunit C
MAFTEEETKKLARLARIHYTPEDLSKVTQELSGIFQWIEMLKQVDTSGVEPMSSVGDFSMPMSADIVSDGNKVDEIMKNAPDQVQNLFAVPKFVE